MSHGVHAVQHEVEHKIEHDEHGGGHGHDDSKDLNKKVALLIAVLALFLAFSETMGKSAQTAALNSQIEASNLWNFFQAKNIRRTSTIVASEQPSSISLGATDPAQKAAIRSRSTNGARPRRATAPSPRPPAARAKAPSNCRGAPSKSSIIAMNNSPSITTTNSRRRPSRSASCWRRRRSSPEWWC